MPGPLPSIPLSSEELVKWMPWEPLTLENEVPLSRMSETWAAAALYAFPNPRSQDYRQPTTEPEILRSTWEAEEEG